MEQIKTIGRYLVGSNTEFSFSKKSDVPVSAEETLKKSRRSIENLCEKALSVGGFLCIAVLGEMTSYYSGQPYYMAVRGAFKMRRNREMVLEYLEMNADKRQEKLLSLFRTHSDRDRDLKVDAVRYFLRVYKHRREAFKEVLSKSEYLYAIS